MDSLFVICEIEEGRVADVSLELLTKGRSLANELNCELEAVTLGHNLKGVEEQIFPYGADVVHIGDDKRLEPFTTLPHTSIIVEVFKKEKPQIALLGASTMGRDLGPRVSSALQSGLTADCTSLEIGDHEDKKAGKSYKNLLYQIRPAFGGNIVATIINPVCRPQMATVREGVMKKEIFSKTHKGQVKYIDVNKFLKPEDTVVKVIERHIEKNRIDIKNSSIIISGGYGMGSKENFSMLYDVAEMLGGEVGASRAAVDAGFAEHSRQVGQTGVTVRPKLYIACGISGQIQHTAGMEESAMVIAINNDAAAPINKIADFVITGDVMDTIPKIIKAYKKNTK
jgi:electron transfer flavoprotein alpha subunit